MSDNDKLARSRRDLAACRFRKESAKHVTNALRRLTRKHHQRCREAKDKGEQAREQKLRDNYIQLLRDYKEKTE